jgi:hypothetical protein
MWPVVRRRPPRGEDAGLSEVDERAFGYRNRGSWMCIDKRP